MARKSGKVVPFNVPKTEREIVRVQVDEGHHFYDQLHQHAEIQIMYILKGEGTLVAGDYVGRFKSGDIYVIGSNQPHVFRSDYNFYRSKKKNSKSISLYFNEEYGGAEFWSLNEWKTVREFKDNAQRGLYITGNTSRKASEIITLLPQAIGINKLILFFTLLQLLASSKNKRTLALQSSSLPANEESRMNKILEFTFRECHRKINISEAAEIAYLSSEAFCRYFKVHTGKTYVSFLNELRISNACRLLIEKDLTIQQISIDSGFNNLSNFNRIFLKVIGKTPLQYRKQLPFTE